MAHNTLFDLGRDILILHVFSLLEIDDLTALELSCRELSQLVADPIVWHALYARTFVGEERLAVSRSWRECYLHRCRGTVFTWGEKDCRLGYFPIEADRDGHSEYWRGVCFPHEVRLLNGLVIRDIAYGGHFLAFLTTRGDLYFIGRTPPRRFPRSSVRRFELTDPSPHWLVSAAACKTFVQVSAGREHILAVGQDGSVYRFLTDGTTGVKLSLCCGKQSLGTVLKISAGWDINAALVERHGIIVWSQSSDAVNAVNTEQQSYVLVPHTNSTLESDWAVKDFAAGSGFVVFITASGHIYVIYTGGELSAESCTPKVLECFEAFTERTCSRYVKVRAGFRRFAALTSLGSILIGKQKDAGFEVDEVPGLEGVHIVDVALGDYHALALDKEGHVYAWGIESQGCGSLGLGGLKQLELLGGFKRRVGKDHVLDTPRQLDLVDVVKIAAGGWQSAAVVSTRPS